MSTNNKIKLYSLLTPLSFIYGIVVWIRNILFDWGIFTSEQYSIPIISIGNLSVGGTGKTPHTEYLIQLLIDKYRIAVLSRGYKRKTSGYLLATSQSTSFDIGDEPYQIKRKYPNILVAVDSNRRRGIQNLLSLPIEQRPEVILLDDAYQHRYVQPSLSIVLSDFHRLFYLDRLLPVGHLREPASNIHRADIVIVTKCEKNIKPIDFRIIENNMGLKAHQLLYFTSITYDQIKPVFPEYTKGINFTDLNNKEILLIAGIANPEPFIQEINNVCTKIQTAIFPDHHFFTKSDFKKLDIIFQQMPPSNRIILVTEKDAARLKDNPLIPKEWKSVLYYQSITIQFHNSKNFDETIKKHIIAIQKSHILSTK